MFGFRPGARAKDTPKPAPSGATPNPAPSGATPKTTPPDPRMLGTGAAAAAAEKLKGRAAQIEAAVGYADGGMVRGPGTGTSDDIKTVVPEGSYIMPADSTEQIGPEQLAAMGKQVPVNLSNGEYQLPPEQVHAVGVQTLDAMKNATHVPAAQQQGVKGFQPRGNEQGKPELFFADGGAVQEFIDSVGGYWSSDNAQFEAGSPSAIQRFGRALNPLTSLGSAIGAMHDAAGQGDVAGMGLAAAQALPVFGSVRAVAPTLKTAAGFVPSFGKTAAATAGNAAFGAAADQYTSSERSFADGGAVQAALDARKSGVKMLTGSAALPFAAGIDAARSGAVRLVGGDPNTLEGGMNKYADAASATFSQGAQETGQALEGFKAGARDVLGVQKAQPQAPAAPTTTPAAPAAAKPAQAAPTAPATAPVAAVGGDLPTNTEQRANDITRVGNSFSGTDIGLGFTINGRPAAESFQGEQSAQNKAAVDALMARTPEFGAGAGALATAAGQAPALGNSPGGPSFAIIGDSSQQDRARQRMISAASTPYRGAQNGQLTANQLRTLSGLIQSDDRNATTLATNSENNAARMAETAMREQGENARTQFREQGQNSRLAARNALDQRRISGEEEARGFQTRAAQRVERLYEQYDQAKPEDRAAIAQQIRELSGGQQQLVTRPAMVFNNQTGDFVPQRGQALPPIGENPAVQKIMNDTSLSREERAKQIRALGYQ